jgi:FkbM family methyltransferase
LPTGGTIVLDPDDWVSRNCYFGLYERPEAAVFRRLLHPGCVAVDVGANIGYWTTHMGEWVKPSGLVIAVEPSPRCLSSLRRAVEAGHSSVISVVACAAGAEQGMGVLVGHETPSNSGLGEIRNDPEMPPGGTKTAVRTLTSILADHSVQRCALVKVDVEGGEPEVLAGLGAHLDSGAIESLAIEVNPSVDTSHPDRIAKIVAGLDHPYRAFQISENGHLRRRPALLPLDAAGIASSRKRFNLLLVSDNTYEQIHDLVVPGAAPGSPRFG